MAASSWAATALVLLIAWAVWVIGGQDHIFTAILIAETACVLSAIAAVMQLRCYAARICRLVRTSGEVQRLRDDAEVSRFDRRR